MQVVGYIAVLFGGILVFLNMILFLSYTRFLTFNTISPSKSLKDYKMLRL